MAIKKLPPLADIARMPGAYGIALRIKDRKGKEMTDSESSMRGTARQFSQQLSQQAVFDIMGPLWEWDVIMPAEKYLGYELVFIPGPRMEFFLEICRLVRAQKGQK